MIKATIGEEIFNSITHGIGAIAALVGLIVLEIMAIRTHDGLTIIAINIYSIALFLLFLMSTLYHGIQAKKAKHVFRIIDHTTIYFFIASTYTPIILKIYKYNSPLVLFSFIIIWFCAIIGILLKIFYLKKSEKIGLLMYLCMGWTSLVLMSTIQHSFGSRIVILIALGGIYYTLGIIFYRWHRLKFHHAYWHMFVIVGSVCHFISIVNLFKIPTGV